MSDDAGAVTQINAYDEFGKPQSTNAGRFQYTGQMWLPELNAYYYKARVYAPQIGRFLQPDPIGYADSPNLYTYAQNDPVNFVDPLGLSQDITVCWCQSWGLGTGALAGSIGAIAGASGDPPLSPRVQRTLEELAEEEIIVTAKKLRPPTPQVITPSLDPFTFFGHYTKGKGETLCLSRDQFDRTKQLGRVVGTFDPNGSNLVTFYGTPLENTFGSANIVFREGRAVGFHDVYNFNVGGASRSFEGQLKTIVGGILGAGGNPFEVRYPC